MEVSDRSMNTLQTNYQALNAEENEVPHESVIFHVASEGGKSRWNHVGDLDSFFRQVYTYLQENGLPCILLKQFMSFLFFLFVYFGGIIYASNCIWFNFDVPPSPLYNKTDIQLGDLFLDIPTCAAEFSYKVWLIVVIGILITLYKCYKLYHTYCCYSDIQHFYTSALKIDQKNLSNTSWHEVQCKIQEVQHEQQMCVHKSDLTELDIHHRILRHKNYMVAMVNKNILPLKHNIKFYGEWAYLSSGLEFNIEYLLFNSYASPFKETGTLREDYKKYSKRKEVADQLSKGFAILALINFLLMPAIFVYSCLSTFISYSGVVRYSPAILSSRRWSFYALLYLRHFNELDHEMHARLCRAYKPSKEYMKSFSSPTLAISSQFSSQVVGSITVFFLVWGIFKERLFLIDNTLLIGTVGALLLIMFYAFIPDENAVYYPEKLMTRIIADIHYVPDHFKEQAHTSAVRDSFSQIFQYKFVSILEEVISPVVTPYILYFHMRPRALDIVDFFRSFTVDVAGVGDVCSFALMDVSRHGNQQWQSQKHIKADQHQQAEDGKTELSLIHFTLMNPHWQPPPSSNMFINSFREKVVTAKEQEFGAEDPYYASLHSLSTMGSKYASLANSVHHSHQHPSTDARFMNFHAGSERMGGVRGMRQVEGPPYTVEGGLFSSLHGDMGGPESLQADLQLNAVELRAADMSFSALYMHETHHKLMDPTKSQGDHHRQQPPQENENNDEESPLLEVRMSPGTSYVQ